jgi:hypothetical protein
MEKEKGRKGRGRVQTPRNIFKATACSSTICPT